MLGLWPALRPAATPRSAPPGRSRRRPRPASCCRLSRAPGVAVRRQRVRGPVAALAGDWPRADRSASRACRSRRAARRRRWWTRGPALIAREAGAGKTSLAEAAPAEVDLPALSAAVSQQTRMPYGPIVSALATTASTRRWAAVRDAGPRPLLGAARAAADRDRPRARDRSGRRTRGRARRDHRPAGAPPGRRDGADRVRGVSLPEAPHPPALDHHAGQPRRVDLVVVPDLERPRRRSDGRPRPARDRGGRAGPRRPRSPHPAAAPNVTDAALAISLCTPGRCSP
jgi:hypothetical protein